MQDKSLNLQIQKNQLELLGKNKSSHNGSLPAITASREIQVETRKSDDSETELPDISSSKFDQIVINNGFSTNLPKTKHAGIWRGPLI